jgi:hypothetical protein
MVQAWNLGVPGNCLRTFLFNDLIGVKTASELSILYCGTYLMLTVSVSCVMIGFNLLTTSCRPICISSSMIANLFCTQKVLPLKSYSLRP